MISDQRLVQLGIQALLIEHVRIDENLFQDPRLNIESRCLKLIKSNMLEFIENLDAQEILDIGTLLDKNTDRHLTYSYSSEDGYYTLDPGQHEVYLYYGIPSGFVIDASRYLRGSRIFWFLGQNEILTDVPVLEDLARLRHQSSSTAVQSVEGYKGA